jgi:hypothetical protein
MNSTVSRMRMRQTLIQARARVVWSRIATAIGASQSGFSKNTRQMKENTKIRILVRASSRWMMVL